MSRTRLIIAALLVAIVAVLFGWQTHREEQVRTCLNSGGAWSGTACGPQPPRPLLQRDLRRS